MESLFLIFFSLMPLLANSEIKVEKDSTTGIKTISSVVSNSENPITEIIFRASSEGEYWLELTKIDKKCWYFKGQLKLNLIYINIIVPRQFKATEIFSSASKTVECTTKTLFNISNIVENLAEAQELSMKIEFSNKNSINWRLPKELLVEWKSVIDLKRLELIQHRISKKTLDTPMVTSEYLTEEGENVPVDSQPRIIKEFFPEYPMKALQNKVEGKVIVAVLVDTAGKVVQAKIAKSSGTDVGFEEAALRAAYNNIYRPGFQNGKPVPLWIYYPVHFRIK